MLKRVHLLVVVSESDQDIEEKRDHEIIKERYHVLNWILHRFAMNNQCLH